MKTVLLSLVLALLTLSLSFSQEKPNLDDPKVQNQIISTAVQNLDFRKKANGDVLWYHPFNQVPYTGWWVSFHENGQVYRLTQFKNGEIEGIADEWYENGQKDQERNYKDGKKEGLFTKWYKNGQKQHEENYKDGKLMSAEVWKPNGERCPMTNLEEGNGVILFYLEDGRVFRWIFVNGERVRGLPPLQPPNP